MFSQNVVAISPAGVRSSRVVVRTSGAAACAASSGIWRQTPGGGSDS